MIVNLNKYVSGNKKDINRMRKFSRVSSNLLLIAPVLFSFIRYSRYEKKQKPGEERTRNHPCFRHCTR